jgi:hypothetical protein
MFSIHARIVFCTALGVIAVSTMTRAQQPEGDSFFFIPKGFEKEGRVLTASGAGTGTLQIEVRDAATKELTP